MKESPLKCFQEFLLKAYEPMSSCYLQQSAQSLQQTAVIRLIARLPGPYQYLPMDSKHGNAYNNIAETSGTCLLHLKTW